MTFINKTCKILLIFLLISVSALALNRGDPNNDGEVNIFDVRICWQYSLGLISLTQEQKEACDVNNDDEVTYENTEIIAEYAIGIRDSLPNQSPIYPFSLGDIGGRGIGWKDGNILQAVRDNKVVTINPKTGEAIDIIEVEAQETVGLNAVTYDGTDIWVYNMGIYYIPGPDDNYFYRVDPETGNIKESVPTIKEPSFWDLTWGNSYLWSVNPNENKIYKIEPSTGNIVANLPAPDTSTVSVTWANGYLWASGSHAEKFFKVDPSDGSVVDSFTTSVMGHAYKMTWDGSYLWCIENLYEEIFRIDTDTGELVSP